MKKIKTHLEFTGVFCLWYTYLSLSLYLNATISHYYRVRFYTITTNRSINIIDIRSRRFSQTYTTKNEPRPTCQVLRSSIRLLPVIYNAKAANHDIIRYFTISTVVYENIYSSDM